MQSFEDAKARYTLQKYTLQKMHFTKIPFERIHSGNQNLGVGFGLGIGLVTYFLILERVLEPVSEKFSADKKSQNQSRRKS